MSIRRNTRSLAAVALAAVALLFLSQPPAHAVSHPPLRTSQNPASPSPQPQLPALLAKAAEYCRKLESSAFDFVCREEISESIDPSLDSPPRPSQPDIVGGRFAGPTIAIAWTRKIKHRFVYDYQCVRAGRTIREMRTQLEENGKRKVVPNAELKTSVVVFGTALLGPVGLFGERFQPDYDFTIAGEEKIGKTSVLVVDAKPKPGAGLPSPGPGTGFAVPALETGKAGAPPTRNLYGKAWINPVTGDILKIEWSESRVGRFDVFEKRGQLYNRKPRLVISSEFSAEKNGIRFPSRLSVEEAYLKESGKAFIRSKTEVIYKDFKFFTVEFDVRD